MLQLSDVADPIESKKR